MKDLPVSQLNHVIVNYPNVNWQLLASAQKYYDECGYKYCEVPYLIPESYGMLTKPHNDQSFVLDNHLFSHDPHELVGSAEQGFIYLLSNNLLQGNKLSAITPCFRTESYSLTHLPWFMKCELFHLSSRQQDCDNMINLAYNFFSQYCDKNALSVIQTNVDSWDINLNGVEVASFGFRHLDCGTFIYGTGLALPRFEVAKNYGK